MTLPTQNIAPEIATQPPNPRDVFKYAILTAFVWLFLQSVHAQQVLLPGEQHTAGDTAVVLTLAEYTDCYLATGQRDTLRALIPRYQAATDSLMARLLQQADDYRQLVRNQAQIIGNQGLVQEQMEQQNRQLKKHYRRERIKTKILVATNIIVPLTILILML